MNERVTRGKVELSLTVQTVDAADTVVAVNQELAKSYQQALRDLSETLEVKKRCDRRDDRPLPRCADHPPRRCW